MIKEKATNSFQICWSSLAAVWPEIPSEQRFRGIHWAILQSAHRSHRTTKIEGTVWVSLAFKKHTLQGTERLDVNAAVAINGPRWCCDAFRSVIRVDVRSFCFNMSPCSNGSVRYKLIYIYIQYIYIRSLDNAMACHGYICKILFLYMDSHGTSWYHKESIQRCFSIKHWHVMMFMVFHG